MDRHVPTALRKAGRYVQRPGRSSPRCAVTGRTASSPANRAPTTMKELR
jgi:hypothetical protein